MGGRKRNVGRGVRAVIALVVLVALLGACDTSQWLQPDGDPSHDRSNPGAWTITPRNAGSLVESWHVDGPDVRFAVGDAVYGVSDTALYSIDPKTGAVNWSRTPSAPITGGPFIDGPDAIRISYGDSAGASHETTFDRFGYSDSENGDADAVPIDGGIAARHDGRSVRIQASAVPYEPSWIEVSGTVLRGRMPVATSKVVSTFGADLVYVPSGYNGHTFVIQAFDPSRPCVDDRCSPVWTSTYTGDGDATVSADGSTLLVSDDQTSGYVAAFDAHSGARRWTSSTPVLASAVSTADDVVFAAGSSPLGRQLSGLHAYDVATGTELWRGVLSGLPNNRSGVTAIGRSVVYAGVGSTIAAFPTAGCGASSCAPLWTADAGAAITSIAIAERHVYVQTTAGITSYGLSS